MLDIEGSVDKAIQALPSTPLTSGSPCESFFQFPASEAQYAVKIASDQPSDVGGHQNPDTAKFVCTNYSHFVPFKNYAILQTRDAGHPQMIMVKPTGGSLLPSEILVKKLGGHESSWTRFEPAKGSRDNQGALIVHASRSKPQPSWVSDRFFPNVLRADKQYAIEFLQAASTR